MWGKEGVIVMYHNQVFTIEVAETKQPIQPDINIRLNGLFAELCVGYSGTTICTAPGTAVIVNGVGPSNSPSTQMVWSGVASITISLPRQ